MTAIHEAFEHLQQRVSDQIDNVLYKRAPRMKFQFWSEALEAPLTVTPAIRWDRTTGIAGFGGAFSVATAADGLQGVILQWRVDGVSPQRWPKDSPGAADNVAHALESIAGHIAQSDFEAMRDRNAESCMFCSKPLTDARSKSLGYGPDCAARHCLPYDETTTAKALEMRNRRERINRDALAAARISPEAHGEIYTAQTGARAAPVTVFHWTRRMAEEPAIHREVHQPAKIWIRNGDAHIGRSRYPLADPLAIVAGSIECDGWPDDSQTFLYDNRQPIGPLLEAYRGERARLEAKWKRQEEQYQKRQTEEARLRELHKWTGPKWREGQDCKAIVKRVIRELLEAGKLPGRPKHYSVSGCRELAISSAWCITHYEQVSAAVREALRDYDRSSAFLIEPDPERRKGAEFAYLRFAEPRAQLERNGYKWREHAGMKQEELLQFLDPDVRAELEAAA